MNILVDESNFDETLFKILQEKFISLDTETTGLYPYQGDRLFALQIGTSNANYYFDFNSELGAINRTAQVISIMEAISKQALVFIHNAKFDLHMIAQEMPEDWMPAFAIHDTLVAARLIFNQHQSYSLASCAERAGMEKLGSLIEDYISQNDLYERVNLPGGKEERKPLYSRVPFELMFEYGCKDVEITRKLGMLQLEGLGKKAWRQRDPSFLNPLQLEYAMTKVLFDMERRGILVDREYSEKAYLEGTELLKQIESEFKSKYSADFVDSAQSLGPLLEARGIKLGVTKDGNLSITNYLLEDHKGDELCDLVQKHRDELKRTNTYFGNFLRFADPQSVIHCNFRQAGTVTGRLSASDPNLQNISKEDESPNPIRKAFIPRPGFVFLELDYMAQEFRMMLDYAKEQDLCAQVERGHDPHQATADMTGLDRKSAKTLNFAILYGVGAAKLSKMLNTSVDNAKLTKARYFRNLPGVKSFIYDATGVARTRGHVVNWNGREYFYPDPQFAYRSPNAIIQGGCSEVVKHSMVLVHAYLSQFESKLILQVHDSLLIEAKISELEEILPNIKQLMRDSYPHKLIKMDTSVEMSSTTWYDLRKYGEAERSSLPSKGDDGAKSASTQPLV